MHPNPEPRANDENNIVSPPRVIVKFKAGNVPPYQSHIEGYDSLGDYIQKNKIGPWAALSEGFPGISINLIFVSVDPEIIGNLVKQALEMDRSYQDPNFLSYFAVEYDKVPDGASYEELFKNMQIIQKELSAWESVELAYIQHGLGPLPAVPSTAQNDEMGKQRYLESANQGGIDAKYAWNYWWNTQGYSDGPGAGIDFIDIERGWDLAHQDLNTPAISLISGVNKESKVHGTSSLGLAVGRDNGANTFGIVGIAYKANARVISIYSTATSNPDHHNSTMTALSKLKYGDVILLEDQARGDLVTINSVSFYKLWPLETAVETNPLTGASTLIWEVIHLGTTLGIIIIEPAGNGLMPKNASDKIPPGTAGNKLLDFTDSSGKHIFDRDPTSPTHGDFKDSGAIMVGAATEGDRADSYKHYRTLQITPPPGQTQPFRLPSNYGCRIDCFGWGGNAWTSGGGTDETPDPTGYGPYNGTSSASAMIAGVTLLIQSLAEKKLGFRLGPLQMRSILSNPLHGTPVYSPAIGNSLEGYMPDLKKILDSYFGAIHEDIFIRDNPADVGNSHIGPISISPDIIVRNSSTSTSNYITNRSLDDSEIITGVSATIYVRAFNRGNLQASNVNVSLYYSEVATLITPANWHPVANNVLLGGIPAKVASTNGVNVVQIPWNNVPGSGHYCFIGLVGNGNDPLIDPKDPQVVNFYNNFDNFYKFIRENNNVTWKNFNVIPNSGVGIGASGFMEMGFFVAGANDQDRPMGLEIVAGLPEGARVWLQGRDEFLFALQGKGAPNLEHDKEKGMARILVNPYGPYLFNDTIFPKDLREPLHLIVELPEEHHDRPYELYARQLYQGEEVGRVTWQLTPPDLIRVNGLTPAERRCMRMGWILVGLLALLVVVIGLHPFASYLAEIIVGLGTVLAGLAWYRACHPDNQTILKKIALGLGIGIVLLASGLLAGLW